MDVDSGLLDFIGNEGLWKAYPPLKKAGFNRDKIYEVHGTTEYLIFWWN